MSDRDVSGAGKKIAQCHHQRLWERISDRADNDKTDMMKCCECGAMVHRQAEKNLGK